MLAHAPPETRRTVAYPAITHSRTQRFFVSEEKEESLREDAEIHCDARSTIYSQVEGRGDGVSGISAFKIINSFARGEFGEFQGKFKNREQLRGRILFFFPFSFITYK